MHEMDVSLTSRVPSTLYLHAIYRTGIVADPVKYDIAHERANPINRSSPNVVASASDRHHLRSSFRRPQRNSGACAWSTLHDARGTRAARRDGRAPSWSGPVTPASLLPKFHGADLVTAWLCTRSRLFDVRTLVPHIFCSISYG